MVVERLSRETLLVPESSFVVESPEAVVVVVGLVEEVEDLSLEIGVDVVEVVLMKGQDVDVLDGLDGVHPLGLGTFGGEGEVDVSEVRARLVDGEDEVGFLFGFYEGGASFLQEVN